MRFGGLALFALIMGAISNTGLAATFQLSKGELAVLSRGEPVTRVTRAPAPSSVGSAGLAFAAIDIPAPPEKIFSVMTNCSRVMKFMKNIVSCRVLSRDPKGLWEIRETVVSPSMLLPHFRSVARADYVPGKQIRFKQTEGNLDYVDGQWDLVPFAGGQATRLFYNVRLGTSLPVPDAVIQSMISNDLPLSLKALRAEVLSERS